MVELKTRHYYSKNKDKKTRFLQFKEEKRKRPRWILELLHWSDDQIDEELTLTKHRGLYTYVIQT